MTACELNVKEVVLEGAVLTQEGGQERQRI